VIGAALVFGWRCAGLSHQIFAALFRAVFAKLTTTTAGASLLIAPTAPVS